jgi:hypothetical protein
VKQGCFAAVFEITRRRPVFELVDYQTLVAAQGEVGSWPVRGEAEVETREDREGRWGSVSQEFHSACLLSFRHLPVQRCHRRGAL